MNPPVPQTYFLIAAALAPALLLMAALAVRFEKRRWILPRSLQSIALAILGGLGAAFIAYWLETALTVKPWGITNLGMLAVFTLLAVGLVEEGAKYLMFRALIWPNKQFKEPYDGVLYAGTIGLSFGAIENIYYVLENGLNTALLRAVTAVPMHGLLGVLLGWYLGKARLLELAEGKKASWGFLLQGLFWATLAHGFYDFLAFQTNPFAEWGLCIFLGWFAWLGFRLCQKSRAISPAWGGTTPPPAPAWVSPAITPRNPVLAALFSVIPGGGQAYNKEWQKGGFLFGVGFVNAFLFVFTWLLLSFPLGMLILLESWGLSLGKEPLKFVASLTESPVLWLIGGLSGVFWLYGIWDAYRTAKLQQFDYLQPPEARRKIVQSISGSYLSHLALLVLLVLVPILQGKSGGGQPGGIEFDLVTAPETLNGHEKKPEGSKDGKDAKNVKEKPSVLAQKSPDDKGTVAKQQAPRKAQRKAGVPRSYSDYLSYRIRLYHDLYFDNTKPDQYTVVRYRIAPSGDIVSVEALQENSTTSPENSALAVQTIESMGPLEPLPAGTGEVEVVELFWNGVTIGRPGSLEERLSSLPDGRWISPVDSPSEPPQPSLDPQGSSPS
jgi:protease PrsW